MVVRIRVSGALQMRELGLELRAMGEEGKGFRRELLAAIRVAAAPAPAAAKAHAREILPHGGGLANLVAADRISIRSRLTGKGVGVRVVNTRGGELLDKGFVKHPVFGNRKVKWPIQQVRPGWFSDPMEATGPAVTTAVVGVILRTGRILDRGR